MNTAAEWLEYCTAELERAGVHFGHGTDNARDEAAWMLLQVLGAPLDGSFDQWELVPDKAQQARLKDVLHARVHARVPLAYLLGEARFCGLDFYVTPEVLVPRSPIAELIRQGFSPWLRQDGHMLDMCTGGGCIAIATAVHMQGMRVDAVDVSSAALQVAKRNVDRHGVADRVSLVESDLFAGLGSSKYALIVSNPPYVPAGEADRLPAEYKAEPANGLFSGVDGLDIVLKILEASHRHLAPGGILIVEVGQSAPNLCRLMPRTPFLWLEFKHGGNGVLLLESDQLAACQTELRVVLEHRGHV